MKEFSAHWQSDGALIALALMWGTSHVITKDILSDHSPAFYTSMRFGIAALCFALVFFRRLMRSDRRGLVQGVILGLCSLAGIAFYVLGLRITQASKAGFITGLYLVFTPLIAYLLFRSRPTRDHLTGLAIALGGFILLSFPRSGEAINWGDILILFAAVSWAAHIAATSAFARISDVRVLASMQVITVAVISGVVYITLKYMGLETSSNPIDMQFGMQIGYMALMVTFVAALVQTWAQGRVSSTHAAILYALEPVTAAVFAYLAFGERLGFAKGIGAGLILFGVTISRLRIATRLTGNNNDAENLPLRSEA